LQVANDLLSIFNSHGQTLHLNFIQSYVALVNSKGNAYWLYKRADPKSYLSFRERDEEKVQAIRMLLDKSSIPFSYNKYSEFLIVIERAFVKKYKDVLIEMNRLRYATESATDEE